MSGLMLYMKFVISFAYVCAHLDVMQDYAAKCVHSVYDDVRLRLGMT